MAVLPYELCGFYSNIVGCQPLGMFKHFRILPFILGLLLGFIGIYVMKPDEKVVFRYPTPDNVKNTTYRDKNGVCYSYQVEKVDCDKSAGTLADYPLEG